MDTNIQSQYKQCIRCVMDTTDPNIVFDQDGICNHCKKAEHDLKEIKKERFFEILPELIAQIKKDGQGKRYDCLIGLSGGVDSSMVLHHAVRWGLRPLCFTVDNGHNTPQSDESIMKLVETLRVPLYRYTIDYSIFSKLQNAFVTAGVANIEIPTDHILMATTYEMAAREGIKWVLSGGNVETESIMPAAWGYNARDLRHIKDIYRKYYGKLTGLPLCGLLKYNYYKWIKGIKTLYLLDFYEYNREESKKLLKEAYGWVDYGEKHEESQFTKWFQEKYLREKFGFDKRKAHYSSMIMSCQMGRDEAIEKLKDAPTQIVKLDPYREYKTDEFWWNLIGKLVKFLRKIKLVETLPFSVT